MPAASPVGFRGAPCAAPHLQGPLCHLGQLVLSPGPIEHLPACKLLLKCNTFVGSKWEREGAEQSRSHLEKVPTPEAAAFWDQVHLVAPGVSGCHLPRKRSLRAGGGGSRRQQVPGLAPPTQAHQHRRVSPHQAPGWLKCSSHQKANPAFHPQHIVPARLGVLESP